MKSSTILRPLLAGLVLTLAQVVFAILILGPEGPFSLRYQTLVQHDSYWFANIVERGYQSTIPPVDHKLMEISNVAFFPAYPILATLVRYALHVNTHIALLVAAQAAAWGFWTYFFLFCRRWEVSLTGQLLGALALVAHPAAFFVITAYSESLFLMALFGFLYWNSAEGKSAKFLAALHGFVMSATRIVGLPCAVFPMAQALLERGKKGGLGARLSMRRFLPAVAVTLGAALGAVTFFAYCFVRWGRWDLYMLTQEAGWAIAPDYLAVLKLENYRWLIPSLRDPTQASQMAMTSGAMLLLATVLCELLPMIRRSATWMTRFGFYFCGAIIYYISVSGVACVQMESMLRYEFCLHALLVLALIHLSQQWRLPALRRAWIGAMLAILCMGGLAVQGWYIWNFTRGNWVA